MTSSIRNTIPTPLEAEYKRLLKQTEMDNNPSDNKRTGMSLGRQKDYVTLSSREIDAAKPPKELQPSQPVTRSEMQALNSQFSIHV